jgi:predicted nucleic acid-binding protein
VALALYIETSAALRAVLETGLSPEIEDRIRRASTLVTSRLSRVESSRALLRLRTLARTSEEKLADAEREIDKLWARCELWELTPAVCDAAASIAPLKPLRTLDALHLATYLVARSRIAGLELATADQRLLDAAAAV